MTFKNKVKYRIEFAQLRQIPIEDVLTWLQIPVQADGKQYRGYCPICNSGGDRSFVVSPKLNRFYCFGDCQSGGDQLELASIVFGVSKYEAAKRLQQYFKGRS